MELTPVRSVQPSAAQQGWLYECTLCGTATPCRCTGWKLPYGWRWHRDSQRQFRALCKQCRWRMWRDAQREFREDPLGDLLLQAAGKSYELGEFDREVEAALMALPTVPDKMDLI